MLLHKIMWVCIMKTAVEWRKMKKTIHWYTKAAEQGNTDAQTQLQFLEIIFSVQ